MSAGYAMKKENYGDADAIMAKLRKLVQLPVIQLKPEALAAYEKWFDDHCPKSKAMITEAKKYIPGGVQHNLSFNHPFPLAFKKAEGAYLFDIDGNRYIDFLQAGGPTLLGSNPKSVREPVIQLLNECGPVTGLFHEYEYKLAKKVSEMMPAVDWLRMLGSGTEADMVAIRIARLATRHKNIIKMGGAYHGWSDQLAYGIRVPGSKHFEAHGVPRNVFKYTQEFYPNSIASLKRVLHRNQLHGGTAAVLIEPIGPESGTRPLSFDFNAQVRELCNQYGALLIFDEVVTAFRMGPGGAQGFFNVEPDLTVFGKIIAGGYPAAGGVGGKKQYMKYLSAGIAGGKAKKALVGGTLAANPLSAFAGYTALCEIERTNAAEIAGRAGDRLTQGLQALIQKYDLPFVAFNQGSICHLETVGAMIVDINWAKPWTLLKSIKNAKNRKKFMEYMGCAYMAEGIVTLAGSRMYTSLATTDEVVDDALQRFERVFKNIDRASFEGAPAK